MPRMISSKLIVLVALSLIFGASSLIARASAKPIQFNGAAKNHWNAEANDFMPFKSPQINVNEVTEWALDPDSKMMVAIAHEQNWLRVYDRILSDHDGRLFNQIKLPFIPSSIFFQKGWDRSVFVVASESASSLSIYDSKTLKELKTLTLKDVMPSLVTGTGAIASPYVYVWRRKDGWLRRENQQRIGRLNIDTLEYSLLPDVFGKLQTINYIEAMPDGKRLLLRSQHWRASSMPFALASIEEDASDGIPNIHIQSLKPKTNPSALPFVRYGKGRERPKDHLILDPVGNPRWAPYGQGFDYLFRFPGSSLVLHVVSGQKPYFKDLRSGDYVVRDFFDDPEFDHHWSRKQDRPRVFHLVEKEQLVITNGRLVWVAAIEDLRLPDAPFLGLGVEGSSDVQIGRESRWQLHREDNGSKLTLSNAPEGMKILGEELVWTPAPDQLGVFSVTLTLASDKQAYSLNCQGRVQTLGVQLDSECIDIAVSDDGSVLGCVSKPVPAHRDPHSKGQTISIIDTKQRILRAKVDGIENIGKISVSKDFFVYADNDASSITVLKTSDLSFVKRIVVPSTSGHHFFGGKFFVAKGDGVGARVFDVPAWRATREDGVFKVAAATSRSHGKPVPSDHQASRLSKDHYFFGGAIYDFKTHSIQSVPYLTRTSPALRPVDLFALSCDWGFSNRTNSIGQAGVNPKFNMRHWLTLPRSPLRVTWDQEQIPDTYAYEVSIHFHDLPTLSRLASYVVDVRKQGVHDLQIVELEHEIACFVGSKVSFIPKPKADDPRFPAPLGFKLNEGLIHITPESSETSTLPLELVGDLEGLYLKLDTKISGLKLEREKPLMHLDRDKLVAHAKLALGKFLLNRQSATAEHFRKQYTFEAVLQIKPYEHVWKRIDMVLGKYEKGLHFPLDTKILAENDAGESVRRPFTIFVKLDKAAIQDAVELAAKTLE